MQPGRQRHVCAAGHPHRGRRSAGEQVHPQPLNPVHRPRGSYVISGASYDPSVLAGKSHAQISGALSDPSSPIAKGVDGTANVITAALCRLTKNNPAPVCTAQGVLAATATLNNARH